MTTGCDETPDFLETYEGDPGPFAQPGTCVRCHDERDDVDEATELCLDCHDETFCGDGQ